MPQGRRWALLWALLIALTWQSFVTQTHVHPDRIRSAQTQSIASNGGNGDRPSPADSTDSCPICREAASAGHVLLPAPVALVAPLAAAFFVIAATAIRLSLTLRSHVWQSRAPPEPVEA